MAAICVQCGHRWFYMNKLITSFMNAKIMKMVKKIHLKLLHDITTIVLQEYQNTRDVSCTSTKKSQKEKGECKELSTSFDTTDWFLILALTTNYILSPDTVACLGLMQYTREPMCFTSRPPFSQPVKKRDSSSFPILRFQLIKNVGWGNLTPASASKRYNNISKISNSVHQICTHNSLLLYRHSVQSPSF